MSDSFEWGTFKDQENYLDKRGIDRWTRDRIGIQIASDFTLHSLGIKRPQLKVGILWTLKDMKGNPTGKFGARVWYHQSFISNDDQPKFITPKGQVPGLYFSPLVNWEKLEYGTKIYICESYLKADVVAMMGFHAIGISGCWGWSYEKQLLWDFQQLPWKEAGLKPIVCFDSNVCEERPALYQSALKLRAEMDVRLHVDASILVLPPRAEDEHWGIDDYYAHNGKEATLAHLKSDPVLLPNALLEHLKILNTEVCVVRDIGKFIDMKRGTLMGRSTFEDVVYADRMADDSEGKRVSVAKIWTRWDGRNQVNELVYRPGAERLKEGEFFNIWEGMGITPSEGDASLFTSWVNDVLHTQVERDFLLNWWSWQLQNPGKKLTTSLVVVGKSGIGKGWLARIAEIIYGQKNIGKVSLGLMGSRFNADVSAKQLLIVEESDEMGGKDGAVIYNRLKDLITSTTIRLERKGVDAVTIDNVLNLFLTGNQIGIFKLDQFDRRFMVCEASNPAGKDICNSSEYWKPRWDWIERGEGASAIYGYLLRRDVTGFDPYAEAPMTAAKRDMIEITHEPLETWIEQLKANPRDVMHVKGQAVDGRIATSKELLFVYHDGQRAMIDFTKGEVMKMVAALKNARIQVASNGGKIKVDGIPERYFLLEGKDESLNWAGEVKDRVFWRRLVASTQGQVAKDGQVATGDTKW